MRTHLEPQQLRATSAARAGTCRRRFLERWGSSHGNMNIKNSSKRLFMSRNECLRFLILYTVSVSLLVAYAAPSANKQTQSKGDTSRADRQKRAATARLDRLWDDAVIPYEIDPIFSDERASLFRSAMRHWENHTCIKFVERKPDEHKNYIVFTERSCGCCSFVGKRGNGPQAISIGKHCDKFGIVVHELGHVVGFWHEHTRPDRDQHVQIINKNIMLGQEYNFNKLTKDEVNSLGLAYDYDSILHYATNTFAKDTYLDTILPLHGHLNTEEVGQLQAQAPPNTPSPSQTNENNLTTVVSISPNSTNNQLTALTRPVIRTHSGTNQTGPVMINDGTAKNLTEIRRQIESDFESMLHYGEKNSGSNARNKRSSEQTRDLQKENRILLLDGSDVVISLAESTTNSRKRMTRETRSVDFDDSRYMLSTDNLLAKTRPEIGQRVRLSVGDIAQTNLLYKCPKCGRTIQQLSGIFHSPNYYHPGGQADKRFKSSSGDQFPDQPAETCEWRLSVGQGERIMIDIVDLDILRAPHLISRPSIQSGTSRLGMPKSALSDHELRDVVDSYTTTGTDDHSDPLIMNDCLTDYFEVRDGYTYHAPVIAKLCGQLAIIKDSLRPIVSTSNRVLVTYRTSSNAVGKRGFLAQHEAICGGLIMLGGSMYDPLSTLQLPADNIQSQHNKASSTHSQQQQNNQTSPVAGLGGNSSTTISSSQKNLINGSPVSENEVLLNSQTRASGLQSQQALVPASQRLRVDVRSSLSDSMAPQMVSAAPTTTSTTPKPDIKTFSWDMWPILNTTIIQSPNWPEYYRPSRECLWQIKAEENHQISLKFDAFDLESHDSCAYDYVEIRDGDSLGSEMIRRYCGSRVPEPILSSGSNMLVKFVSDSDVNKAGFLASLQLEIDECKLGTHGCSYKCSNTAIPYKCECPNGLELAPDGRNCVPTCGGIRNEASGQITSPSFPDLYPISTRCVWEIHAPAHHRITLNFTHFDLEGIKSQECDYDFVEIWSKLQDGKYVKNGIFCGPNQAFAVTSVANFMRIEFNSDNSIQKSGFDSNYFIDRDECATNNGGCQHVCTNNIGSYQCSCNNGFVLHDNKHDCVGSHCLHNIAAPEGTFQSPNFPSLYEPNKECAWVFSAAPGHRIRLIFDQFDLEGHQECAYDYVAVFDGETLDDHLLGRFCGSRRPLTLVSSYNLLYLVFRSDATTEKRGFNATHSTICGGRLQANLNHNGLIFSHPTFDGTSHYSRNEDCDWIIEANENQRIRIEFTFFSLEADSNCNYDQTIVYDGSDDSATQLARLCGDDKPKDQLKFTSSGDSMLIVFKSDDSINSKGFSLVYTAIEASEEEFLAAGQSHPLAQLQNQQHKQSETRYI